MGRPRRKQQDGGHDRHDRCRGRANPADPPERPRTQHQRNSIAGVEEGHKPELEESYTRPVAELNLPVDAVIDRLDDALRSAGFDGLAPPRDGAALDEASAAVHPYELPYDLLRFWRRVDPSSIRVAPFPELIGPAFALDSYRMALAPDISPRLGPPLLFPCAYSSQVFRLIELQSGADAGGTIFHCELDDTRSFRVDYRSFTDLLEVHVELVEERSYRQYDAANATVPEQIEAKRRESRTRTAAPHHLYGDAREIPNELMGWPVHWLESAGIDLSDRQPLGATHTIAAAVSKAPAGASGVRIAGTVAHLVGSNAGTLVLVEDPTGQLEVWCPAGVSPWGPVMGGSFEFAVTVESDPPAAVATDVRPLD